MTQRRLLVNQARILILGLTFKENCPDIRNTRVTDIVAELRSYNAEVEIYDPWASPEEVRHEYGIEMLPELVPGGYDAVLVAVAHKQFRELGAAGIRALAKPEGVIFDVKYALPADAVDGYL
jgi:UDP-N-acetyl-D-galactosamine dehydrogenase